MMQALGNALVTQIVAPSERGRALGLMGTTVSIGIAIGPPLGGLLIGSIGWQSVFWVNVPVGILTALAVWRFVPACPPSNPNQRFDGVGALVLFFTLGAYALGMTLGQEAGFSAPWVRGLLVGALIGLAMSAKITGALLLPALVIAHLAPGWQNGAGTWRTRWRSAWTDDAWGWFAPSLGTALGVFALVNPSVWQAFPAVRAAWHAEAAMVWGRIVPPYTRQFLDATPILYPITQHMQWFLGPTAALLAWGGTLWALWRAVRRRLAVGEVIVLAVLLPAMGVILSAFAQFPRYWLPLFPLMALLGSGWLVRAVPRHWQPGVAMFGITPTLLYALAFVSLYKDAHPWWLASAWLCENMPPGAVLLVETWDQPLPIAGACDGRFVIITGDPYTPEGVAALPRLAEQADAIVLSSPRSWQTHARQSAHFPEAAAFYRSLFAGDQFEVAAVWRPEPSLGGVALSANLFTAAHVPTPSAWEASAPRRRIQLGRYDESFAVYDHPVVLILTRR
ncbi:MAG: MFS transporter [Ardenticatenia bacterium]|nr:MAG: MFS transporter [Ardenticatenia bacterium]